MNKRGKKKKILAIMTIIKSVATMTTTIIITITVEKTIITALIQEI